ncbi:MAG: substrate-binding domain-containing protein [Anaerolineales bacterium]|nr:substrate-binding domain-containing protein [Anaerolineales bacterium]
MADASEPALAQTFIDFVLSPEGQAILAKWGFEPPPAGP